MKANPEADTETFTSKAAIALLIINTFVNAIAARLDLWGMSFIFLAFLLVMLQYLRRYIGENLPNDSPEEKMIRIPTWLILTTLHLMVAYTVSFNHSIGFTLALWAILLFSSCFTFYMLFIFKFSTDHHDNGSDDLRTVYASFDLCKKPIIYKISRNDDGYITFDNMILRV